MKFLVDAQLPPSLARWISSRDHEATHIFDIDMHTAGDAAIWEYAGANGCVLLTKDKDFRRSMAAERSADCARMDSQGNCSNDALMTWLEQRRKADRNIPIDVTMLQRMPLWSDPDTWARLRSGERCVICRQGLPRDLLVELETSWVTVNEDAPMRGYSCLVLRRHAVELHDLDDAEGAAFMRDIRRLSSAVQQVTGAVKLNYDVHGNTIPHLHMHFYPRYPGDPFEGGPIDPKAIRQPVYAPGEYAEIRRRLREALVGAV